MAQRVVDGEWVLSVQHAPDRSQPQWPSGPQQQQIHLDLHVDDLSSADDLATELGGRRLQPPQRQADNPDGDEMFAVYASPAGQPFCFGVHQREGDPWRSREPIRKWPASVAECTANLRLAGPRWFAVDCCDADLMGSWPRWATEQVHVREPSAGLG